MERAKEGELCADTDAVATLFSTKKILLMTIQKMMIELSDKLYNLKINQINLQLQFK